MIKKIIGVLSMIAMLAVSGKTVFAQNLYVEPSIGVSAVNNVTNERWTINKNLDQQYSFAIGKDISNTFAVEEKTTYAKTSNKSVIIETVNAKVKFTPTVYLLGGVGVAGIPSTEIYGFAYTGGIGFTGYKPFDIAVSIVNASKEGIDNQLVASIGIKID